MDSGNLSISWIGDAIGPHWSCDSQPPTTRGRDVGAIAHIIDRGTNAAAAALRPSTYPALARELSSTLTAAALYPLGVVDEVLGSVVDKVVGTADPATDARPVVLVHGYGSIKSHWLTLNVALRRIGISDVTAINYNPWTADIRAISAGLVAHVDAVLARTGADKVNLVGHSMGGLVIRHAVEVLGLGDRVDSVVTIASPHGGSAFAYLAGVLPGKRQLTKAAAQMRPGSRFLRELEIAAAANAATSSVKWTALYSTGDLIVPGRAAKLRTPNARNIKVDADGHVAVLSSPYVVKQVCEALAA